MKRREGFVSNSSSSSFIVAIKDNSDACPHCGRRDPSYEDLLHLISRGTDFSGDSTEEIFRITNEDEIRDSLSKFWYDDTDSKQVIEDQIINLLKKQFKILGCSISYHDEALLLNLENLVSSGAAVILYDGENKIGVTKKLP